MYKRQNWKFDQSNWNKFEGQRQKIPGNRRFVEFERTMSAIPAFTPMEFGLVGLITSTRTDQTTCIPHWRTRRRSRSFAMFDGMMSAIPAFAPMEFGLVGLNTST